MPHGPARPRLWSCGIASRNVLWTEWPDNQMSADEHSGSAVDKSTEIERLSSPASTRYRMAYGMEPTVLQLRNLERILLGY